MKIELPNGAIIHCENVEEFTAALPLLQRPADPEPALLEEEEAVTLNREMALFTKLERNKPTEVYLSPDEAKILRLLERNKPTEVYLSPDEAKILRLLRRTPELTSAQVGQQVGMATNIASAALYRLRTQRPGPDTLDGLVGKISLGRWKPTPLGQHLKIVVTSQPKIENRRLGWFSD